MPTEDITEPVENEYDDEGFFIPEKVVDDPKGLFNGIIVDNVSFPVFKVNRIERTTFGFVECFNLCVPSGAMVKKISTGVGLYVLIEYGKSKEAYYITYGNGIKLGRAFKVNLEKVNEIFMSLLKIRGLEMISKEMKF